MVIMFKSKRFIAFIIAVLLFILMMLCTSYEPIESATAITMITGIYIGAQSLRGSQKQ